MIRTPPFIPFNSPYVTGNEIYNISKALNSGHLSGDGPYTKACHEKIVEITQCQYALLTHSCTAALEMCALILDIQPGDEVILPSYTFVSTANAFALRGATIKFADISMDNLCLSLKHIKQLLSKKTKAIVAVHYAGISTDLITLKSICDQHNIFLIEDNAQGICSTYLDQPLGSFGQLACLSFHETKNISCGEGGALLINDPKLLHTAEVVREKGTNRSQFFRGEIDKYTWVGLGSSFLPSEISSAFLHAQLNACEDITSERLKLWNIYFDIFSRWESSGILSRPIIPSCSVHNAHIFYVLFNSSQHQKLFIQKMRDHGIHCTFHYIPLHSSPKGIALSPNSDDSDFPITNFVSSHIVRLPLWIGVDIDYIIRVIDQIYLEFCTLCTKKT